MQHSENLNELAAALAKAQAKIPPVKRSLTAKIESAKGSYTYDYADLASILDAIRAPLADNGLAIIQAVETNPGSVAIETMLAHASGQWITHTIAFATGNDPRSTGTAITYGRRYGLSLTGVVTEEDDDGASATRTSSGVLPEHKATATQAGSAATANVPVPTCPICNGPMWDNRAKVAQAIADGKKPGPEWACKDGKWNPQTKQTDGCAGKLWAGEWPPREKPSDDIVKNIVTLAQDLYGKATGATMKAWLEKDFQVINPKGLKDGIEHLTPDQADAMYTGLLIEQDKRRAEMNASGAEVDAWGTDAEK